MSRARIYFRNLTANWVGYGANLVIMFFMSPFVIHRLGDVDYGVWSLMMTLTGYLGLVEIGTRGGLGRFINYYLGKKDIPKVNGVINTAMAIFVTLGGVLLAVSAVLAALLHLIFPKIPAELLPATRIILFLIAGNLWISFLSAAFRQLLEAHERFDLRNVVDLSVVLVRTGLTVAVLLLGRGLVALAVIQVATSVLGMSAAYILARRVFPRLELRPALISRERFKELFGFSIWAFIGGLSYRLLYSGDNIVIGILLGPKWVTYYSVGGLLLYRSRELISQASSIFAPQIMQDCATGDYKSLRILFRRGSNLTMGICILVFVGMLVFGKEFIILWMGPEFAISYRILAILTVSSFMAVAFQISGPIYFGLNRVKLSSILVLTQGLANLGLTIILVSGLKWGIEGVAWGTFYPRIIWGLAGGLIAMRWIQFEPWRFFRTVVARWVLLGTVFGLLCMVLNRAPLGEGWPYFFWKIVIAAIVYIPLSWLVIPNREERQRLGSALKQKLKRKHTEVGVSENAIN